MAIISNAVTIADAGAFSVNLGSMVHIKTLTASSSGTLSFVHGTADVVLDSTYPIYKFEFINIHPATDNTQFMFNFSVDTGSNYNVSKVHTVIDAYHSEDNSDSLLGYSTAHDMVGTGFAKFNYNTGNDADQSVSGNFTIYNPSSTTFVKHYIADTSTILNVNYNRHALVAGYGNSTSAVDALQFKMSSGNIDSGKIKLYGIKDS